MRPIFVMRPKPPRLVGRPWESPSRIGDVMHTIEFLVPPKPDQQVAYRRQMDVVQKAVRKLCTVGGRRHEAHSRETRGGVGKVGTRIPRRSNTPCS